MHSPSNLVGIVLMDISIGVSVVTSAVSKYNQVVEEAQQKVIVFFALR